MPYVSPLESRTCVTMPIWYNDTDSQPRGGTIDANTIIPYCIWFTLIYACVSGFTTK